MRKVVAALADNFPTQRGEDVEREALQCLQWRGREDRARKERDQDCRNDVPSPDPPHRPVAKSAYSSRSRRPMIGVGEAVALASIWKV